MNFCSKKSAGTYVQMKFCYFVFLTSALPPGLAHSTPYVGRVGRVGGGGLVRLGPPSYQNVFSITARTPCQNQYKLSFSEEKQ